MRTMTRWLLSCGMAATILCWLSAPGYAFRQASVGRGAPARADESAAARQDAPPDELTSFFWHGAVDHTGATGYAPFHPVVPDAAPEAAQDPVQLAQLFMAQDRALLGIVQEGVAWDPVRVEAPDDLEMTTVVLQETYAGLPVFATQVLVQVQGQAIVAANGEFFRTLQVDTAPALTPAEAYKRAVAGLALERTQLESSQLVIFNPAVLEMGDSPSHLTYQLILTEVEPPHAYVAFVDADTGKLLFAYDNLQHARNRIIHDLAGSFALPGPPCQDESGSFGVPSRECNDAFVFTGATYDYFWNTHGRDSFDGAGATMRASVRLGTMANAFWNGQQTAFGPGFATLDVVAHEWAHGVTQYSANLVYASQSGALNESMSDIFAAMVDRDDWLMGEELPIGAVRSLADPTRYGDPGRVGDPNFYCGVEDNGGVHTNSGVPNHAAYLMAEGGSYNGRTIASIGRDHTERIFYRALTRYLSAGSSFADAYQALISSCSDLYGVASTTCANVTLALDATEMNGAVCRGQGGPPDLYEPDDGAARARGFAIGSTQVNHNFHVSGDVDWVRFVASAGAFYAIETLNLGSRSDTYLTLYDADGATILETDDDGGDGLASRIEWRAPTAGAYFVSVRHYSRAIFGANTSYDLRIGPDGNDVDAYEPDNGPAQARTLMLGSTSVHRNFHEAGDVDWVKVAVDASASYVLETLNLGRRSDTYLTLYDTDGVTILATNDDSDGLAARIEWVAPRAGVQFVSVRHHSRSTFGAGTDYDLRVTSGQRSAADPYEPDNHPGQARAIEVGATQAGRTFHVVGDVDWLRFPAAGGAGYVIETLNLGTRVDTVLTLYAPDGATVLATNDDSVGLGSRIEWVPAYTGHYFISVRNFNRAVFNANGGYDLRIMPGSAGGSDRYEPDDSPGQARPVGVGAAPVGHTFHRAGDTDWARFTAAAGVRYVIETLNLGSRGDTVLTLYGADGATILAVNDDSGDGLASRIEWVAAGDGMLFVAVRHYSSAAFGAGAYYDLRVTVVADPAADRYEPDDSPEAARAIDSSGVQLNHSFHRTSDLDWAKFVASAGASYVIETANLATQTDTLLSLYGPDGKTLLASNDDGGDGRASRLTWRALNDGIHYIQVRQVNRVIFGPGASYDLRLLGATTALASTPKIAAIQPAEFSGGVDAVLSVQGAGFMDTPKIYLRDGYREIGLDEVVFINSEVVWGTSRAGAKPGVYKVWLENPDRGGAYYAGSVTITPAPVANLFIYAPLVVR